MKTRYQNGMLIFPEHSFFITLTEQSYRCGVLVADSVRLFPDFFPRHRDTREEATAAFMFLVGSGILPITAMKEYSVNSFVKVLKNRGLDVAFANKTPPSVKNVEASKASALLLCGNTPVAILHNVTKGTISVTTTKGTLQTEDTTGDLVYQVYMALVLSNILPQADFIEAQDAIELSQQLNTDTITIIRNKFQLVGYLRQQEDT